MLQKHDELCKLPVFVYGTLKRNHCNHRVIKDAKFVDTGITNGFIFSVGAYPAFVNQGAEAVKGELFHITKGTLARLDHFEGKDFLYDRVIVDVTLSDGKKVKAWIYEYINVPPTKELGDKRIPTGEWTREHESLLPRRELE